MLKESPFRTEEQKRMHREYWELNRVNVECCQKMHQLRKDFCNTLPFNVGDYVIFRGKRRKGWITRMTMDEFFSTILIYFNPPKKDGTQSKKEELILIDILNELDSITIDKTK